MYFKLKQEYVPGGPGGPYKPGLEEFYLNQIIKDRWKTYAPGRPESPFEPRAPNAPGLPIE